MIPRWRMLSRNCMRPTPSSPKGGFCTHNPLLARPPAIPNDWIVAPVPALLSGVPRPFAPAGKGLCVQKPPLGDDGVGRMQFLLSMRQRGIMDAAVLRALDEVPREHFVEGALAERAYADQALPIDCGQTISQ